ncbi:MAG: uroporphyrinogen decarboxylase family protein [bacterium]
MRTMTSRERMLTALDRGVPDRLPVSVHDWMEYFLQTRLGGMSKIDAFIKFELDWSIYLPWTVFSQKLNDNWIIEKCEGPISDDSTEIETTIVTPEKRLHKLERKDKFKTSWITEYLLKNWEDIFIWCKYFPDEKYDLDFERSQLEMIGDRGILRGCRVSPWHKLCELYGPEKCINACFDDPSWIRDALAAITEIDLRALDTMVGTNLDLLETGGGFASSTVISPNIFKEFLLPFEKRIHAHIREKLGIRTVYHTCGGMMPILDLLAEIGSTALETLTPPSMGGDVNLAELKKRVGDKVALIGGFDQNGGFQNCSPDQTRKLVRHCFETAGANGGYILNPSDHFFDADLDNFEAYSSEARKCVY